MRSSSSRSRSTTRAVIGTAITDDCTGMTVPTVSRGGSGFDPRRLLPMASNSARPAVAMTIKMVRNDKRSAPSGADRAVTVTPW